MKRNYSRNYNNGHFASRDVLASRKRGKYQEQIIGMTFVVGIVFFAPVCLRGATIWIEHRVSIAWGNMIAYQVELRDKAYEVTMPTAFAENEEQEPMGFIPSIFVKENVPAELLPKFLEYSDKYKVPIDRMAKIMSAESSFNPKAYHKNKKGFGEDFGICQQNNLFWKKKVESTGLKFGSLEGCFYIYSIAGAEAWNPSKHMWIKK